MIKVKLKDFYFLSLKGEMYKIQTESVKFNADGQFRYAVARHGNITHNQLRYTVSFHTGWESLSRAENWDFDNQISFWYKGTPHPKEFHGDFYLTLENGVKYIVFPEGIHYRVPTKSARPHERHTEGDELVTIQDKMHAGNHFVFYYKWEKEIFVDEVDGRIVAVFGDKKMSFPKEEYSWRSLKKLKKILK